MAQTGGEPLLSLKISRRCMNDCVFCSEQARRDNRAPFPGPAEVRDAIGAARRRGITRISLLGGEPTLHPDLPLFIRHARGLGFSMIHLCTNGRRLAVKGYLDTLIAEGLTHLDTSIHADSVALAERISRSKGSFAEQADGLARAAAAFGEGLITLTTNTVIHRANQKRLARIVAFLGRQGVPYRSLYLARPAGAARTGAAAVLPDLGALRDQLAATFAGVDDAEESTLQTFGVPFCLLPEGRIDRAVEFRGRFRPIHQRLGETGARLPALDAMHEAVRGRVDRPRGLPPRCRGCTIAGVCPRPDPLHLRLSGDRWISPVVV